MPPRKKEERRRGKKRKTTDKHVEEDNNEASYYVDREGKKEQEQEQSTPSWLLDEKAGPSTNAHVEPFTPFGLVDVELKAYLRSAHIKLNELMEIALEDSRAISQDEEVKTLRNAMLDEIKGKELTLATDSDTSRILEDMLHSFSERQTRILAHSLIGSNEDLFRLSCHRFGSHLLQSTLLALQTAASQEEMDKAAETKKKSKVFSGDGKELRSAQELVLDVSEELRLHTSFMLSDQFGTHVLRTLLMVLSGQASNAATQDQRSKKSRHFQKKTQSSRILKAEVSTKHVVPSSFRVSLESILDSIRGGMESSRMKTWSTDSVAGPTLTLVIELSMSMSKQVTNDSDGDPLLNVILDGLVSNDSPHHSEYLESLIRDSVGSHMLQRLLQLVNGDIIARFWQIYIKGNLCKLGVHPIANFVIAAVCRRLGEEDDAFGQACNEVALAGEALIKSQKLGILIALADRGLDLSQLHPIIEAAPNEVRHYKKMIKNVWSDNEVQSKVSRAILKAFGFCDHDTGNEKVDEKDREMLIKVLASGKTKKGYRKEIRRIEMKAEEIEAKKEKAMKMSADGEEIKEYTKTPEIEGEEPLFSMQGSLLCQSLLRLPEPGNTPLLDSLLSQPSLLPLSTNAITVHIILAPFQDNARTSFSQRTALSTKILSQISAMLSDKFASRVIDCIFDKSDAFFKEKIMKKCIEEENAILTTNFGRYFLKRVNISLFRKDVVKWKKQMRERKVEKGQHIAEEVKESITEQISERPLKKVRKAKVDQELDSILADI